MGCGASTIPKDQQIANARNNLESKISIAEFAATDETSMRQFEQM
jgi:hypothetical protein